jgi:addiction module RelE/StbE family toxin
MSGGYSSTIDGGNSGVNFVLLRSSAFIRAARKILKKQPEIAENVQNTLELLATDPFHPRLRTHKLKGDLEDSWACSAGYDLRIIFRFVEQVESQAILLESIGTHDEVY